MTNTAISVSLICAAICVVAIGYFLNSKWNENWQRYWDENNYTEKCRLCGAEISHTILMGSPISHHFGPCLREQEDIRIRAWILKKIEEDAVK